MSRIPRGAGCSAGRDIPGNERARRDIAELVDALGGHGSILASCAWHVLGLEWSVRKWALTVRRGALVACGILVAVLAFLEQHFASGGA
jgi:hypothetical protein